VGTRLLAAVIAAAALAPADGALARTGHSPTAAAPSKAKIRAALRRAEHSGKLWATVNICNTNRHPNVLGIRGQMPALSYRALLTMRIQVKYWSDADSRFKDVPHTRHTVSLGTKTTGTHQGGLSFQFSPHAGFLAATIRFDWIRSRRSIGHVTRWTTPHHPDADAGDPRHFSAWKCVIS
jgi:hypothetical protein